MTAVRFMAAFLICMAGVLAHAGEGTGPGAMQVTVDIKPQPLDDAINQFAEQSGLQIVFYSGIGKNTTSPHVVGTFTTSDALNRLLANTTLSYEFIDARTIAIGAGKAAADKAGNGTSQNTDDHSQSGRKLQSQNIRLSSAQTNEGNAAREGKDAADKPDDSADLQAVQEVIVTAQKRNERLQDVPVPVTSIDAESLTANNQMRLQDYYSTIPGLSLNTSGEGDAVLAVRGVTTGSATNSTVAITVDDVPVGTSSALTNNNGFIPDIDPSILERIEVLRGPQGTLYGASSIGGLVKYVTLNPSTDGFSGRIQTDVSSVSHGQTLGYGVRGAVNIPLSETAAVRASGFYRDEPGYIDDPVYGLEGVDRGHSSGGLLSALWQPTDALSVKLTALLQDKESQGMGVALLPGFGDLQQTFLPSSRGAGAHLSKVRLYSANVRASLGEVDLTSITSYSVNKARNRRDASSSYGPLATLVGLVADGALYDSDTHTNKFTQEVRATSSFGGRFDWLLGAFYTRERSPVIGPMVAADALTGDLVGPLIGFDYSIEVAEYAAFADLTVHFTDRFDVQFGGRESSNRQVYNETDYGPLVPVFFPSYTSPLVAPTVRTRDRSFTFLVTPRFMVSPELMLYARVASGYRTGGPNAAALILNLPEHVQPDETLNYEVGVKGSLLGRRFTYDVSAYSIHWQDVQFLLTDPVTTFAYFTNAGGARSRGLELSIQARPFVGTAISAWAAWNDSQLTQALPETLPGYSPSGASGDRLPYSSRSSGSISIEQEVPVSDTVAGYIRASASYVGDRKSDFIPAGLQRLALPSYVQANLIAGVRLNSFNVSVFVNNLADKRGVVSRPNVGAQFGYTYIEPRTVGVALARDF